MLKDFLEKVKKNLSVSDENMKKYVNSVEIVEEESKNSKLHENYFCSISFSFAHQPILCKTCETSINFYGCY